MPYIRDMLYCCDTSTEELSPFRVLVPSLTTCTTMKPSCSNIYNLYLAHMNEVLLTCVTHIFILLLDILCRSLVAGCLRRL